MKIQSDDLPFMFKNTVFTKVDDLIAALAKAGI